MQIDTDGDAIVLLDEADLAIMPRKCLAKTFYVETQDFWAQAILKKKHEDIFENLTEKEEKKVSWACVRQRAMCSMLWYVTIH